MIKSNVFACLLVAAVTSPLQAQISVTDYSSTYFQDFDTLVSAGASGVVPTGWHFTETGSLADSTYTADDGTIKTPDTYSFGSVGSSDRAFGTILNPLSNVPTIGAEFRNDGTMTITGLTIAYRGEEWHCETPKRTDQLDFQYSLDATSLTTGTWIDVNALDFATPNSSTKGAFDGNAAGNFTVLGPTTISGLNVAPGTTIWIRWSDFDAQGGDDGLGIDNFSASYTATAAVPEPTAAFSLAAALSLFCGFVRRRS